MLSDILTQVAIVVGLMVVLSTAVFIGRDRLEQTQREWLSRVRVSAPVLAVLACVLVFNRIMRDNQPDIGVYMTRTIRSIEGEFVLIFQAIASEDVTLYFSFTYIYGYAFLLIFPPIAYFALSNTRPFRRLLTAYSLNYAIGVVIYALVIAYGPRNFMPELPTILYNVNPEAQHLTREVNRNTNVFPSLHTSLSATVAMFAYQTRSEYPNWFPVSVVFAVSVIISTMYLGIHWGIDVIGGLILAVVCVVASDRIVGRWSVTTLYETFRERLSSHVE
ncbi:phosphatase PAP2 family protein [Haloterrigena alkaliphila]|uniref:Inositol phosphorylceramide synthase n=1 Tax=Haloterrigena alkaliphila TaxID=2816475 RepID=A0A8A2VCD0_9EURY|nr:phosphatase PAP2 family protein [Haloterrigena alkaliphila]QSW98367.1 phosphatase PAP2 family protein [Haloterrigena alkaliphila]